VRVYEYIQKTARARGCCFLALLDPDKLDPARLRQTGKLIRGIRRGRHPVRHQPDDVR